MSLQQDVGMVIDQARQNRGMAEIDDLRRGRRRDVGSHLSDTVALHQNI